MQQPRPKEHALVGQRSTYTQHPIADRSATSADAHGFCSSSSRLVKCTPSASQGNCRARHPRMPPPMLAHRACGQGVWACIATNIPGVSISGNNTVAQARSTALWASFAPCCMLSSCQMLRGLIPDPCTTCDMSTRFLWYLSFKANGYGIEPCAYSLWHRPRQRQPRTRHGTCMHVCKRVTSYKMGTSV